jgi:uncharacterized membrane protein
MKLLLKDILFFIIGCSLYLMIEIFFRGYSFRLMGIAGGLIFLIGSKLNDWFSWDMDLLLQCLVIALLVTLLEAIIGNIDYYYLHLNMWNYNNLPLNFLNGKICVGFSCIWFLFGFPIVILADCIDYYWLHTNERPYYRIFKWKFKLPRRKNIYE